MHKIIIALLSLMLSARVDAYPYPPKPERCPTTGVINTTTTVHDAEVAVQDFNGQWVVATIQKQYDTSQRWTLVVAKIDAASQQEAIDQALKSLSSLQFDQGPLRTPNMKKWRCVYHTAENYLVVAVTPPLQGMLSAALY